MSKTMIIIGIAFILLGVLWPFAQYIGLGQLPGDITIKSRGFTIYLPFTTCILVSAVVSIIVWFFTK